MNGDHLRGVIAAAATPITADLAPDLERFADLCRWLLDNGCDGLNICGTTGEATSFSLAQRKTIMSAAAAAVPLSHMMAGTGAASVSDAVDLTRHAADLGFAGALVLPPFYYKGVGDDGVIRYIEHIVSATADAGIAVFLYHFPALSGVAYSPALVSRLISGFGERIAGLKDSSGDLAYAKSIVDLSPQLRVFPSNEAVLLRARAGEFAGCISASTNVNSRWCALAFHEGDEQALDRANGIRTLVSRTALIPSVKATLAHMRKDDAYEATMPPLSPLSREARDSLIRDIAPLLA